jgi:hypothetical protein
VYDVAFSPGGGTLATGDDAGEVALYNAFVWQANFSALKSELCNDLKGFEMTGAEWNTYVPDQPYRATCP